MLTLSDKKIDFLRDLICMFYEQTSDTDRVCAASTVVGVLDYIISTENVTERTEATERTREESDW
jgi:hypothetical protein